MTQIMNHLHWCQCGNVSGIGRCQWNTSNLSYGSGKKRTEPYFKSSRM